MHIVLVDDSIPFDGHSPGSQPLGGAEKAFASLPGSLARRGHRVQVFNRCADRRQIDGASWESWQGTRVVECDVLIAFRKPELLGFVANARHKLLWLAGPARYLATESNGGLLFTHRPTLVFMGEAHRASCGEGDMASHGVIIQPGVPPAYLEDQPCLPLHPPYAVATSHPQLGLDWLIKLWIDRVWPQCPHAELRLYSSVLDRALLGGFVPEPFKAVSALALEAQDKGIVIRRPRGDPAMAEAYRGARAHLYPGDIREAFCSTLAESQACGLPAVARPFPATAERIADGISGHLAVDAEAFVRTTLSLLEDDRSFARLSEGARARARTSWDETAAAFEAVWR